jgi:hypothetical protein
MTTSIQKLKGSLIKFVDYMVKGNTTQNTIYEQMANTVWSEEIQPFLVNENITTWEVDIKKKFIDNPYVRFSMSEKQAYCLARAFAAINPETIIF